jgi:hypothetical protein
MNKENVIRWTAYILVTLLYFLLIFNRNFYIQPFAEYDSTLQVKLANYIYHGQWLGPYTSINLAKGISYPFFLVLLHAVKLPLWLGLGVFNLLAVSIVVGSLKPLFNKKWMSLLLFGTLLLHPILFDVSQATLYRDSITYGSILLLISWVVGTFNYSVISLSKVGILFYSLIGVIILPFWINLREDAFWMYPFIIVALLVTIVFSVFNNKWKQTLCLIVICVLPVISMYGVNGIIKHNNFIHYGRSVVNDYVSRDFKSAYGALTNIKTNQWVINVPVNSQMRARAYDSVKDFKKLQPFLDGIVPGNTGYFKNFGVAEPSFGNDYQGGWFFWALRRSAYLSGEANTAPKAERYYTKLSKEINKQIKEGKLKGYSKERASLSSKFNIKSIKPSIKFSGLAIKQIVEIRWLNYDVPYVKADQDNAYFKKMADFTKAGFPTSNVKDDRVPIFKSLRWLSAVIELLGGLGVIVYIITVLRKSRDRNNVRSKEEIGLVIIFIGIMLEIILRIIMLGYISATSFISLSNAYLSSLYALIVVESCLGIEFFFKSKKIKTKNKK